MMLKPGTQIIYVPNHADGPGHSDCEKGFVVSIRGENAMCRYFRRGTTELRTLANSESTPIVDLVATNHCLQGLVETFLGGL